MTDLPNGGGRRLGAQPFSREMLRDHLERNNLKYLTDQDGDFRVDFAPFHENAPDLSVWLTAEGVNEDVCVVRVLGNVRVPKTNWVKVILACNQWNQEKRYPKAYLYVPEDPEALFGQIHLEGQFPLSAGVTQPMLDEFVSTIIGTGFSFWEWVVETDLLAEGDEPAND